MKLRISITDRCNLRCIYCKPLIYEKKEAKEILSFEEIKEISLFFIENFNLKNIKLTGGEPLLRKNFLNLVEILNDLKNKGLETLSITTNGTLLKYYAKYLKGKIDWINVSLDTTDKNKFKEISGGKLNDVLEGIKIAKKLGIPVKINCVLIKGINEDEIESLLLWSFKENLFLRFIEYMPFKGRIPWDKEKVILKDEIIKKAENLGNFRLERNEGDTNIILIRNDGFKFGIIPSISNPFCFDCNRLRLTSDGFLLPCLKSKKKYQIKNIIKEKNAVMIIKNILSQKKESINKNFNLQEDMVSIGG